MDNQREKFEVEARKHGINLAHDAAKPGEYAFPVARAAWWGWQAAIASQRPDKQTDLSKRLRAIANNDSRFLTVNISKIDLIAAAHEIDRYYTGMLNWKATAEAKDVQASQQDQDAKDAALIAARKRLVFADKHIDCSEEIALIDAAMNSDTGE